MSEPERRSVFSTANRAAIQQRVVHEVECACGHRIPVRVRDVGGEVACTRCKARVPAGAPAQARPRVRPTEQPAAAPRTRIRYLTSPLRTASILCVLAGAVIGGWFVWDPPPGLVASMRPREANHQETGESAAEPFDPDALTISAIEDLLEEADPFGALFMARAWHEGLLERGVTDDDPRASRLRAIIDQLLDQKKELMLRMIGELATFEPAAAALKRAKAWVRLLAAVDISVEDPRRVELSRMTLALVERVNPITTRMIEQLRERADTAQALAQATVWQQALRERGAPEADTRFALLVDVARELKERLISPVAGTATFVREFQATVQRMADSLRGGDFKAARAACDVAEKLLEEHTDELAAVSRRFVTLKARLKQAELREEGFSRTQRYLDEFERAIASGDPRQVSHALECRAEAKFTAFNTPLDPAQAEQLVARAKAMTSKLRLALGVRAVDDALRCDTAGDKTARDQAIRRALMILPGLPEQEIRPHLSSLASWIEGHVGEKVQHSDDAAPMTPLGREIARRELYEQALEHYGELRSNELTAACQEVHEAYASAGESTVEIDARLAELVLNTMETRLAPLLESKLDELPLESVEALQAARSSLKANVPWQAAPRWKTLSGAVGQQSDKVARQILTQALQEADAERFSEALKLSTYVESLGEPELVARVQSLAASWRIAVEKRAERMAEEDAFAEITALAKQKKRHPFELLLAMNEFAARFPKSAYLAKMAKVRERTRNEVDERFADEVVKLGGLLRQSKWDEALPLLRKLESVARDGQRARLAVFEPQIAGARERAIQDLSGLGFHKKMLTPNEIVDVLEAAGAVLLFDSEHPEAKRLYDEADAKGDRLAAKALADGQRWKEILPKKAREQLKRAADLDLDGPSGREARKLLEQMDKEEG